MDIGKIEQLTETEESRQKRKDIESALKIGETQLVTKTYLGELESDLAQANERVAELEKQNRLLSGESGDFQELLKSLRAYEAFVEEVKEWNVIEGQNIMSEKEEDYVKGQKDSSRLWRFLREESLARLSAKLEGEGK